MASPTLRNVRLELTAADPPGLFLKIVAGQRPELVFNFAVSTDADKVEVLSRWLAELDLLDLITNTLATLAALDGCDPAAN